MTAPQLKGEEHLVGRFVRPLKVTPGSARYGGRDEHGAQGIGNKGSAPQAPEARRGRRRQPWTNHCTVECCSGGKSQLGRVCADRLVRREAPLHSPEGKEWSGAWKSCDSTVSIHNKVLSLTSAKRDTNAGTEFIG